MKTSDDRFPRGAVDLRLPRSPWITVLILSTLYALATIDRLLPAMMLETVKRSLGATDTELAFVAGTAFSLGYCIAMLPMGWLADRWDRRVLIGIAVVLWSSMALACGYASSITGLVIGRVGLGIGEAALVPCAFSLIADRFGAKDRPMALMVFVLGSGIGGALAAFVGGILPSAVPGELLRLLGLAHGWQATFVLVGLTGMAMTTLIAFVHEPRAEMAKMLAAQGADPLVKAPSAFSYMRACAFLLVPLVITLITFNVFVSGIGAWIPAFFMRSYEWTPVEVAQKFGTLSLVVSLSSIPTGGIITGWIARRSVQGPLILTGFCGILATTSMAVASLMNDGTAALVAVTICLFAVGCAAGAMPTAILNVVPSAIRGRISSIYSLLVNLAAVGGGPLLFAVVTDGKFAPALHLNNTFTVLSVSLGAIFAVGFVASYRKYKSGVKLAAIHDATR